MNDLYQVTMKGDYQVLFFGTLNECERWIHYNGMMNVTYEVERRNLR